MTVRVSVIIPAYNTAAYIARAIESALKQTIPEIEVIVVDDGSSDDTAKIAKSFTDPRVKVVINQQNLGVSATRNRALKEAVGEWIAVLDSDDWYVPERLEKLLQIAELENADIVTDDLYLIRAGEAQPWTTLIRQSRGAIKDITVIDPVAFAKAGSFGKEKVRLGLCQPIFRHDFLTKHSLSYDEELNVCEDYWLSMTCLVKGARFILVPQPYYFYYLRPSSLCYSSLVKRLEKEYKKIESFISGEKIDYKDRTLAKILAKNKRLLKSNLSYYRVIEPLKNHQWAQTLKELFNNPGFWGQLFKRIPAMIKRRIEYYFLNNRTFYDLFS